MIVKIQLPLAGDMRYALIYTEDRSIQELMPVKTARKAFGKSKDVKGYFTASLKKTILNIGRRVEPKDW